MKTCRDCGQEKNVSQFHKDKSRKDGYFCYCKECAKTRQAEWRKNNPQARRETHLSYKYGISVEQFQNLLDSQGGVCAICKTDTPGHKGQFVVDHNHDTGEVRGLLCARCNAGLGHFNDNLATVAAAVSYLSTKGSYG